MIVIESKKKKYDTIERKYPDAVILDVTSNSVDGEFVKFSPFYPHYGIPVPGSPSLTAASVEGVWQGLKTFRNEGISFECLKNDTMKNIKRTERTHGKCLGHRYGERILDYVEARKMIYVPTYNWVLMNRLGALVNKLEEMSSHGIVVLLDYDTNGDVENVGKPLSHASLIKTYIENRTAESEKSSVVYGDGMKVRHAKFGEGEVVSCNSVEHKIVVAFAGGEKTLNTMVAKLEILG